MLSGCEYHVNTLAEWGPDGPALVKEKWSGGGGHFTSQRMSHTHMNVLNRGFRGVGVRVGRGFGDVVWVLGVGDRVICLHYYVSEQLYKHLSHFCPQNPLYFSVFRLYNLII